MCVRFPLAQAATADGPCCSQRLFHSGWRPNAPGRGNRLEVSAMAHNTVPEARGLYDPANDSDACGVGFIAELDKGPTRSCVVNALEMLLRMTHRGACGCEVNSGARRPSACILGYLGPAQHALICAAQRFDRAHAGVLSHHARRRPKCSATNGGHA